MDVTFIVSKGSVEYNPIFNVMISKSLWDDSKR